MNINLTGNAIRVPIVHNNSTPGIKAETTIAINSSPEIISVLFVAIIFFSCLFLINKYISDMIISIISGIEPIT